MKRFEGLGDRYERQRPIFGDEGQANLRRSTVLIAGAGALGSHVSNLLARAGVRTLRICDDDKVSLSNLHRQILYFEEDLEEPRRFKVELAAERLRAANSEVEVEVFSERLGLDNFEQLSSGVDLVCDCTDQLQFRFLLNRLCFEAKLPWIYGGIEGTYAMGARFPGGSGPCFECLFGDRGAKDPLKRPVLNASAALCGAFEAALALQSLSQKNFEPLFWTCDPWKGEMASRTWKADPYCSVCGSLKLDEGAERSNE